MIWFGGTSLSPGALLRVNKNPTTLWSNPSFLTGDRLQELKAGEVVLLVARLGIKSEWTLVDGDDNQLPRNESLMVLTSKPRIGFVFSDLVTVVKGRTK